MAHQLLYDFVADLSRVVEFPEPIVEFGSMQVEEGQPNDVRPLFHDRDFIGTDFREGPGVDRVEDLRDLSFGDGEIGTALCLDTLEHCADPLKACREMHRVLADGGICVITSVMLIGIHAHPSDYWRFTPEGFRTLLEGFDDVDAAGFGSPEHPFFVFGAGTKGRELGVKLAELPSLAAKQREYERAEGKVKIGPFRLTLRELGGTLSRELPRAVRERAAARLGR
jgi:SAM-dependent methyltransferase